MSPPTITGEIAAGSHQTFDDEYPMALSLDSIQAPAAFVDRAARILHANSAFYNLVQGADLGDANWLAAFEQGESVGARIGAIKDSYDLTASCFNYAGRRLMLWVATSANAHPMAGRRDPIRLVSLHCGSEAVRLGLALRDESSQGESGEGDGVHAHALQRHYEALLHPDVRGSSAGRPLNPARQLLESLADQAPHENSDAIGGSSITGRHTPFG